MTTAAALRDPWTSTDHDPTCWADNQPAISTRHELAMARAGIRDALTANHYQRLAYAINARDHAAAVLDATDNTLDDRLDATHYLVEAEAIIAITGGDTDD
jgi:hypothetical protein